MAFLLAEIAKQPHKFDCIKLPMVLELEALRFTPFHLIALLIFILAILHTLSASWLHEWTRGLEKRQAPKRKGKRWERSPLVQVLFFLSEVEVIFALWVVPLAIVMWCFYGLEVVLDFLNTRDYTEPLFVVVILALSATRPIIRLAEKLIHWCAKGLGGSLSAWWFTLLTVGPLLGSFLTEVGAMTLSALLLSRQFYEFHPSSKLAYATIALLFVNVSVGGILTDFASPAVLVLAHYWHWTTPDMIVHFGWKAALGIIISNIIYWYAFRKELKLLDERKRTLAASRFIHSPKSQEAPIPPGSLSSTSPLSSGSSSSPTTPQSSSPASSSSSASTK